MDFLDIFALVVLLTLLLTVVGVAGVLGWLPGHIAATRNHPQTDAIRICGWLGLLTLGILLPLAFVWAFARPRAAIQAGSDGSAGFAAGGIGAGGTGAADLVTELRELKNRLAAIETKLNGGLSADSATQGGRI